MASLWVTGLTVHTGLIAPTAPTVHTAPTIRTQAEVAIGPEQIRMNQIRPKQLRRQQLLRQSHLSESATSFLKALLDSLSYMSHVGHSTTRLFGKPISDKLFHFR
jgi:hypothetical protein